jgi:TolA-binding protein
MTTQEFVDQKIRQTLGEMHVQIILLQARIAELEGQAAQQQPQEPEPVQPLPETAARANGREKGAN